MSKKEPWKLWLPPEWREEVNAKRIVDCVTFCQGFTNEQLADMGSLKKERISQFNDGVKTVREMIDEGQIEEYQRTPSHE